MVNLNSWAIVIFVKLYNTWKKKKTNNILPSFDTDASLFRE